MLLKTYGIAVLLLLAFILPPPLAAYGAPLQEFQLGCLDAGPGRGVYGTVSWSFWAL